MADQWTDVLKTMPPGTTDLFEFVKGMITDQMFPQFGTTYWAFVWLALALISVTLIAIILGFYTNIKQKGYSWMIVQDGACTRISPKAWVPFFWGAMCAFLATQIVWTYRVLKFKSYSGSFVAYSVIVGVIPILSFAGLTLHVLTSTPHLRRFLIGFNSSTSRVPSRKGWVPSVILVNSLLLVWCIFVGAILAIPGRRAYQQGELARTTYASAMALIDKAKITGDLAGLAGLNDLMPTFDKMEALRQRTNNLSGYIFSSFFIFYLFSAIFPALFLNTYIRNRIRQYDLGMSTNQDSCMTSSRLAQFASDSAPPAHAVPGTTVKEDARRITVRLPANRPFANIIEVKHTTAAPPHLQRIIDQKGTNPTEKSARLKAALRRDNQMLFVYCLLLLALGSLAAFQLTGAPNRINASKALRIAFLWEVYSFCLPAFLASLLFLWDACRNQASDDEIINAPVSQSYPRHKATDSLPNIITLSQHVTVVEEYAMDEKPGQSDSQKKFGSL